MNNDLIFEETKIATTESEIVNLEKRLNIKLPSQYRDHILKYNGGYSSLRCFNMPDDRITKIHYFYAIYEGKYSNFENTYTNLKIRQNRMLPHIFPIAYDEGGNQICISIEENDYGYIYFWDHEEETDEPSYENMYLIANSFNEFLDGLFDCPPLDIDL